MLRDEVDGWDGGRRSLTQMQKDHVQKGDVKSVRVEGGAGDRGCVSEGGGE